MQVEKHIQRVCHSIMGLDSAPDAHRAFIFVTGSYLRGKQETGNSSAYHCDIPTAQTSRESIHVSTSAVHE